MQVHLIVCGTRSTSYQRVIPHFPNIKSQYIGAVQKISNTAGWVGVSQFCYKSLRKKLGMGLSTSALRNADEKFNHGKLTFLVFCTVLIKS